MDDRIRAILDLLEAVCTNLRGKEDWKVLYNVENARMLVEELGDDDEEDC